MNSYHEKIARLLRTDKRRIEELEAALEKATGKFGVLEAILKENDSLVDDRLKTLGLNRDSSAHEVYDALISKVEADDVALLEYIGIGTGDIGTKTQKVVDFVKRLHPPTRGIFLKKERARQFLIAEPPKKILAALGYKYVEEMLEKEDLLEVYSALRFLEDMEWLNTKFFKQYESLRPDDFEERQIEVRALHPKWAKAAEKFVAKKYHNISHLKELGIIFIIPVFLGISGETMRSVTLLLHYLHEVAFYAGLFKKLSVDPASFAKNLISLFRGDVVEHRPSEPSGEFWRPRFLVVERYLAKDDENDWRLFEPRINPEAVHWYKAVLDLAGAGDKISDFKNGLDFWKNIGPVGEFFKTDVGVEVLVSFDIVDTAMALVKQRELLKYLYHQQEALWNKVFTGYFGFQKLEEVCREYILKDYYEI